MRYYIKNNMVSLTGSSYVLDEGGNKVFLVKGRFMSPTHKKMICDLQGNPLFSVRNKYWRLFHRFVYINDERGGEHRRLCRVRSPFFGKWRIDDNAIGLSLEGIFMQGTHIYIDGRDVGMFYYDYNFTSVIFADSYTLEVYDESLLPFLVALVVGYDNIRDQHERAVRD